MTVVGYFFTRISQVKSRKDNLDACTWHTEKDTKKKEEVLPPRPENHSYQSQLHPIPGSHLPRMVRQIGALLHRFWVLLSSSAYLVPFLLYMTCLEVPKEKIDFHPLCPLFLPIWKEYFKYASESLPWAPRHCQPRTILLSCLFFSFRQIKFCEWLKFMNQKFWNTWQMFPCHIVFSHKSFCIFQMVLC